MSHRIGSSRQDIAIKIIQETDSKDNPENVQGIPTRSLLYGALPGAG
jgi:hypothetical protein